LPYTSTGKGFGGLREIQENSDSIFEVVHRGTPNTAIQALMMLQQVAQHELLSIAEMSMVAPITDDEPKNMPDYSFVDRIYRAIYGKLTVDDIASTNKHSLLLNVVYKAIKCDPLIGRARAFLKRLVQVAASSSANFAAGSIYLVAEVLASRKELRSLLISKSLRKTKVGIDIQGRPKISNEISAQDRANALARLDAALDEEEEEEDDDDDDDDDDDEKAQVAAADALQNAAGDGIRINVALYKPDQKKQSDKALRNDIAVSNILIPAPHASLAKLDEEDQGKDYDIYKREPRFAGASSECLWELAPLALHFHPSVRRFAESVMYSPESSIKYDGDPLADF
jgi:hypothetical protein